MRMISFVLAAFIALLGAIAHAQRPVVEVHAVAADGTLGPSLVTPFVIERATARAAEVQLQLAPATAKAFADVTTKHQGEKLAIVVDGVVQSTPLIRDPITGGRVSVTLQSPDDARRLARALGAR